MSFFRNIRSSLSSSRAKSSSRDTTPVRNSRPSSVISSRRDSTTSSRADSTLQRGDTFILSASDEERQQHSNTSTLEKKSKKSKVFSKFSTFTKRKKTPSPADTASYEHHPSDTATNTYYKWKNEGDRMLDYDAQADPFNFLYEQQSSLKALQAADNSLRRPASIDSNSSGTASFDSGTYRKSKTPTYLREQLEQLKTHSKDDLLEQQEEDEREKYKTITLSSFRKSFRDRLLQGQKETPHNPAWFVEVETPTERKNERCNSKENRPDFLVFENENYRPQSRSPLRERPSRSMTRSPVKRNETFRVAQPMLRNASPSPTPRVTPSIRIEIKNPISPHAPGRIVPVGVAKPMPTTEYYAQRLQASNAGLRQSTSPKASNKWSAGQRYQTLVQIGSEQSKSGAVLPSRGRAPTRIQLYGNKPSAIAKTQPPSSTYFGDHLTQYQRGQYNAPAHKMLNSKPLTTHSVSQSRAAAYSACGVANVGSGGVPSVYLGRREQPAARAQPRRNRSPIKVPWR